MGTQHGAAALSEGDASDWVQAHTALSRLARERAVLDVEEGRWLRRAWRSAAHVHLGYGSFAQYIEPLFGYKPRSTREKLRVAEALETLPRLAHALEAGSLSWCAARELTRFAVPETEQAWLDAARGNAQHLGDSLPLERGGPTFPAMLRAAALQAANENASLGAGPTAGDGPKGRSHHGAAEPNGDESTASSTHAHVGPQCRGEDAASPTRSRRSKPKLPTPIRASARSKTSPLRCGGPCSLAIDAVVACRAAATCWPSCAPTPSSAVRPSNACSAKRSAESGRHPGERELLFTLELHPWEVGPVAMWFRAVAAVPRSHVWRRLTGGLDGARHGGANGPNRALHVRREYHNRMQML